MSRSAAGFNYRIVRRKNFLRWPVDSKRYTLRKVSRHFFLVLSQGRCGYQRVVLSSLVCTNGLCTGLWTHRAYSIFRWDTDLTLHDALHYLNRSPGQSGDHRYTWPSWWWGLILTIDSPEVSTVSTFIKLAVMNVSTLIQYTCSRIILFSKQQKTLALSSLFPNSHCRPDSLYDT